MKTVLKVLLAIVVVVAIMFIGIWGAIIFSSTTETAWQIWGWFLATLLILSPAINFWFNKLTWLLDLED